MTWTFESKTYVVRAKYDPPNQLLEVGKDYPAEIKEEDKDKWLMIDIKHEGVIFVSPRHILSSVTQDAAE